MGLAITEEHQALAAVVRSFAADQRVRSGARAALDADAPAVPETWKRIGDLGWLNLHLSEQAGGSGFGLPELAVVVDELGHAITPGPLLATATASAVLSATGGDSLHEFVTRLGNGSAVAGLGLTAGLTRDDDGAYSGELTVLAGRWADVLLLAAGDDLLMAPTTDAAVDVVPVKGLDPSLGLAKVSVTGLVPADGHVLAGALGPAVAVFRTLAAAEAPAGRGAAWTSRWNTPGYESSSAGASAASRRSNTTWPTCWSPSSWPPRSPGTRPGDGQRRPKRSWRPRPRPRRPCAATGVRAEGRPDLRRHRLHLGRRPPPPRRALRSGRGGRPGLGRGRRLRSHPRRRAAAVAVELPEEADAVVPRPAPSSTGTRRPGEERRALLVSSGYLVPHWPSRSDAGRARSSSSSSRRSWPGSRCPRWASADGPADAHPTADQEQVERWITPTLLGEITWCQLFSEPGAGSDLARWHPRRRVEGGWRVTGQKVWTRDAQHGRRGICWRAPTRRRRSTGITLSSST